MSSFHFFFVLDMVPIYVSDKLGNDQGGDGAKKAPFKTVLQAMRSVGAEPFPEIMVDRKDGETGFELIAKAQLKKMIKLFAQEKRKQEEQKKREVLFGFFLIEKQKFIVLT